MKNDIILVGGGGHCKAVIDVLEQEDKYKIIGILDPDFKNLKTVLNYPVLGDDSEIDQLSKKIKHFFITVGQAKSASLRIKIYKKIIENNAVCPKIISPLSYVSKHSKIGEGTIIMHGAKINANANIGNNCIINTNAIIEHDASVGNHCHISTGAIINGFVKVGDEVFIGSSAVIADRVSILNRTVFGAGSVVVKSNLSAAIYVGNPVKKINNI
jgi:sugar O-acyltransferase (sialic acid O-acetyltransferase NeuD family)